MKKEHFLLGFFVLAFTVARAQTVDEIINKHIDAIGGRDKISQIKSVYIESTVQTLGNENPSTTSILNGKAFKTESEFNGQKIIQCYTDKGGWVVNPFAGSTDPQPMPEQQYKAGKGQIYVGGPLVDYASKGYKAELLGKEGTDYKIKLTSPDNNESTYYIDQSSYYITRAVIKSVVQGQNVDITSAYSDYQKTDFGFVIAHKIDLDFGQFQLSYTVKKVEINKDLDPKIFEMPK